MEQSLDPNKKWVFTSKSQEKRVTTLLKAFDLVVCDNCHLAVPGPYYCGHCGAKLP